MSRTYVHVPIKILLEGSLADHRSTIDKHCNTRYATLKRWAKRVVRHAMIDEEENRLTDSVAKSRGMSHIIRDRYW